MAYSQKYCIAHILEPLEAGYEFRMDCWPLHVTLVDVFAVDRTGSNFDKDLQRTVNMLRPVRTVVTEEAVLSMTEVMLLEKNRQIIEIHETLAALLESHGAVFNIPEFNHKGFLPHCTIQKDGKLAVGNEILINSVSLVDMFPEGDWRQRKIIATYNMNHAKDAK